MSRHQVLEVASLSGAGALLAGGAAGASPAFATEPGAERQRCGPIRRPQLQSDDSNHFLLTSFDESALSARSISADRGRRSGSLFSFGHRKPDAKQTVLAGVREDLAEHVARTTAQPSRRDPAQGAGDLISPDEIDGDPRRTTLRLSMRSHSLAHAGA
jgi:hypothetical protein